MRLVVFLPATEARQFLTIHHSQKKEVILVFKNTELVEPGDATVGVFKHQSVKNICQCFLKMI